MRPRVRASGAARIASGVSRSQCTTVCPFARTASWRGSSANAARYAQYLLGSVNRIPVAFATPSLYTLYDAPPKLDGSVVIGISQSGASPDVAAVVAEGRRQGRLAIALTNDRDSTLARAADHVLPLHAGPEQAVAATKTYVNSLAAIALLSAALAHDARRLEEL